MRVTEQETKELQAKLKKEFAAKKEQLQKSTDAMIDATSKDRESFEAQMDAEREEIKNERDSMVAQQQKER